MNDALTYFLASLPDEVSQQLDYSPASLNVLESWLLERYPNPDAIIERYEHIRCDDIGRYIGETFVKSLGGFWDVTLDWPDALCLKICDGSYVSLCLHVEIGEDTSL